MLYLAVSKFPAVLSILIYEGTIPIDIARLPTVQTGPQELPLWTKTLYINQSTL